jgi:hemerythrin-like metal-binding protein
MRLEWSNEDYVFAPNLDSDHRKLFEQIEKVRRAAHEPGLDLWRLSRMLSIHFASEERLMQECRYPAIRWHKRQHQAGRNKMGRLVESAHVNGGERLDGALEEFACWFKDHIHLADRMFAAHLRNDQRGRVAS